MAEEPPLFIGHHWGEPPFNEKSLRVKRIGEELEVIAAMPSYSSDHNAFDLIRQYEIARRLSVSHEKTRKDPPHIAFANATTDEALIDFVRTFGPVVCKAMTLRTSFGQPDCFDGGDGRSHWLLIARQDLSELRNEQKIFKAALGLVGELAKNDSEYSFESAREKIVEIAQGIRHWPSQWSRERKTNRPPHPLWELRPDSLRRIATRSTSNPDPILARQLDARIVLCELINVFPVIAFPNPLEMHGHLRYGIRPALYSVLRHEFFQPRDFGSCANTQCRSFFEIERSGQRFCNDICSRQQRQREYWESTGKAVRQKKQHRS